MTYVRVFYFTRSLHRLQISRPPVASLLALCVERVAGTASLKLQELTPSPRAMARLSDLVITTSCFNVRASHSLLLFFNWLSR